MGGKRSVAVYLAAGLLLASCAINLFGQAAATGAILGTVRDATGAVVPDAEVSVTDVDKGETHTARTNQSGSFDIEALPAGGNTYDVTITKSGFRAFALKGVVLHPSERRSIDAALEV